MSNTWETHLERWTSAGLVDAEARDRIVAWEAEHREPGHREPQGLRWPVWIALVLGAMLLGAGVLLFVSSHWDQMSAAARMTLIVVTVATFHVGGAFSASRFEGLSITLHTLGTVALGGAIALTGQIYNLSEHWPTAVLLWAAGAALTWALLGHWTQAALTAILVPYWLAGEWLTSSSQSSISILPVSVGVCALSFTYLSARRGPDDSVLRKALGWLGGLALLPATAIVAFEDWWRGGHGISWEVQTLAWGIVIMGPLALAFALRGREALWTGIAIAWSVVLGTVVGNQHGDHLPAYLWCGVGAAGLAFWGTRDSRPERVNLGIAGFALTVLTFYFSDVMDRLDRATGLVAIGLLFLGGGWLLERTRRRLMAHIRPEAI